MAHDHDEPRLAAGAAGYEHKDANLKGVMTFVIGLAGFVVLVLIGLTRVNDLMFRHRARPEPVSSKRDPAQSTLIHQREQLLGLRERENAVLDQYGWVDRQAGTVRVPIARAIDLLAERGIPAGKGPKSAVEINSHAGTPATPSPAAPVPSEPKP